MSFVKRKPEETIVPAGTPGNVRAFVEYPRNRNAAKLQAQRDPQSPWFIWIYEPLTEPWQVPRPSRVHIWWCYVSHIVFYKRPWTDKPGTNEFERWAAADAMLRHDDVLRFEGENYRTISTTAFWHENRWWARHRARREANELDKYPFYRENLYRAFRHCTDPVFKRDDIVELTIMAFRQRDQLEESGRLSSQEFYDLLTGLNLGIDL